MVLMIITDIDGAMLFCGQGEARDQHRVHVATDGVLVR